MGCYLDITGCAHLFGGERALLQIVCGALSRRGFAVSAAIASTSICARTLTRQASGKIVADGEEAEAVARCRSPRSAPVTPSPAACAAPA